MAKGYRIIARRYRSPLGELDLVARRGRVLAFVEVKQRAHAGDARLVVVRFGRADSEASRAMQARVKAYKAAGGKGKGSLTVAATGCRTPPVPAGPIRMSAWLRAEAGEPYFVLMRDVDMRKTLEKAGADAALIPPC